MDKFDENVLDRYFGELEKKDIEIPDVLEARILDRIERVDIKKKLFLGTWAGKFLAVSCLFIFLFTASVKWIPGFAAYASGIPIVKYAVEWIKGDSGTELARREGYPEFGPVTIEQNGYRLVIDHIMFDEDRLVMSLHAYGDKIEEVLPGKAAGEPVRATEEPRYTQPQLNIRLKYPDFKDGSHFVQYGGSDDNSGNEFRAEKVFEEGEVRDFLADKAEFLTISADIVVHRDPNEKPEVLQSFKNIKIPLDINKVKMSRRYTIKNGVTVDKTRIVVDSLTVSPTRMRVDVSLDLPEGYFFTGFENPYIKDSKGNIYKPEGLVSRHSSETTRSLLFVPSIYFEDSHDKVYFGFDGIRIGAEMGKSFTISMKDSYPRTINYMDKEIVIEKAAYTPNRAYPLNVQMRLPKEIKVQGIKIEGAKGNSHATVDDRYEDGNTSLDLYGVDVEYRDEYEAELSFPGYLIGSRREISMGVSK